MNKCNQCGECCKFLVVGVLGTSTLRAFYEARGCSVIQSDGETMLIKIHQTCPHLTKQNKCDLHGTKQKPVICSVFPEPGQTDILPNCGYYE